MTINFGQIPVRASFTMSRDADFYQVVRTKDGSNFPMTTVMSLVFLDADDQVLDTWTATVDGATATFNEDEDTVGELLDDDPVAGRLFYEDGQGGPELLLAQGPIHDMSP